MNGLTATPRHDDPRIADRRIRVSDILYALAMDEPLENLYFWGVQEYKIDAAVAYYRANRDWYEQADDTVYDVAMLDDGAQAWNDNKDQYDYEVDFPS